MKQPIAQASPSNHTCIKTLCGEIEESAQVSKITRMRYVDSIEVGQVFRQGDIYIHCVSKDHPRGSSWPERQLAPGNTKGSRHVAEAPSQVYLGIETPDYFGSNWFRNNKSGFSSITGPFVQSEERFLISHPEHSDVSLPAGSYQITFQMDPRTSERVLD